VALETIDFSALPAKNRIEAAARESARGTVINFGYLNTDRRTKAQNEFKEAAERMLPKFNIRGKYTLDARRYNLWKYIRKALGGKDPAFIWQQTGSCVGAGGGNMSIIEQGVEIALKGAAIEYRWPWWLYTYGRSRFRGGIQGSGEGSFGTAWQQAATGDGLFELDPDGQPDLPDPKIQGGWAVLSGNLEMQWSDGAQIASNWLEFGQKRLFHTASPIRSADDAIASLANGYPLTCASNFGFAPMTPPVAGKSPNQIRLVSRWNATWGHQMWIHEFWDHPDVGPVFGWGNNWGPDAHGEPPSDYPAGLFYVTYDLTNKILANSDTEAYAFSQHDGFPARETLLAAVDFSPLKA